MTEKIKAVALFLLAVAVLIAAIKYRRADTIIVQDTVIDQALTDSGYTPIQPHNKPVKPPQSPAGVEPVLTATGHVGPPEGGVWPDTLPVVVSVVQGPQDVPWIGAWVGGQQVIWQGIGIDWPSPQPSPVSALVEYSFRDRSPWGVGVAWEPLRVHSLRAGPALTASADASWAALSGRISYRAGPLSLGGGIGINTEGSLHSSVSAGLAVDLN